MRSGFLPGRIFFVRGGRAFFQGVFAKIGVLVWCFCGEVVVDCVVNRGALMAVFWRLKICHCFGIYFAYFL
jgi:hypothetical protein